MAYTKYSLTPANNTAAPPDGAPEGMLPSAVNDTMRDMMAQIRDCGDGVRDGTYTMTAVKITGGTINGATIGATTATTGKFTAVTNSALTSGRVTYAGASGLLSDSANFVFDGTNVGIGTNSPSAKLDITSASAGFSNIKLVQTGVRTWAIENTGTSGLFKIIEAGVADRLVIDSSGNVGIGVTPNANDFGKNLQINQTILNDDNAGTNHLTKNAYYNSGWKYISTDFASKYTQASSVHSWYTAPSGTAGNAITFTQAMTLNASGNLGIGTTSPTNKLQVTGGGLTVNGTSPAFTANAAIIDVSGSVTRISAAGPDNTTNGTMAFNTASANAGVFNERMRIDASGRLLLNQTSNNGTALMQMISPTTANAILIQIGTNGNEAMTFLNAGGVAGVGSIVVNSASTTYSTSSDYRLKENIAPMTGALATVAQLKPVTYKWKADGSDGQGFIAHELQAVVPDCVTGEKDGLDKDGKPKYQGVDTSFLVATLVSAIQEQQALIESLTTRLTALEFK
jgi:hypothetical protein